MNLSNSINSTRTLSNPASATHQISQRTLFHQGALALGFIVAMSQISIPLTPVPITGQTLSVVLIGLFAHRFAALGALASYATLAAFGAPILSGGSAGIGASFGFVLGFIPAAYFVAKLSRHYRNTWHTLLIPLLGLTIPYLPGLIWLGGFLALNGIFSFQSLFTIGVLPFLFGDILKLAIAICTFKYITVRQKSNSQLS